MQSNNKRNNRIISYKGKTQTLAQWCDELELDYDTYIVFCWNKDDFYHMLPIINNVIYDKEESSMNLFTLKLYKSQK